MLKGACYSQGFTKKRDNNEVKKIKNSQPALETLVFDVEEITDSRREELA
jgi:hypothetical protein